MKNKRFQYAVALFAVTALFVFAKRALPSTEGLTEPSYTTFSTRGDGIALLYDTLKIMGYPVGKYTMLLDQQRPINNIQIIIAPDYRYASASHYEGICDWVIQGGTLLYFDESYGSFPYYVEANSELIIIERIEGGVLYNLGLGKLFIGEADYITNIGLIEGGDAYGQQIANMLSNLDYNKIYFNEAYHGYGTDKGLFESLPPGIRLFCLQLILLAIAVIIYFGKRFGRIIPYYEEVEREENEYVFTLTNLYMSIGLGSAAIDVYDKKFKKACGNYFRNSAALEFSEILILWKNENLRDMDKLEYIARTYEQTLNTKRPNQRREFMKIISYYKELIHIVSKL